MTPASGAAPCPYVGLQPFQEADRELFFGRERDQRIIIANLFASPLTILYGSSGVGKSSVLMAGVVPQLRRERPRTPVVVFRNWVGDDFQQALIRACIDAVWTNDVGQPKPAETLPLDEVLRACGEAAHATVLILIDQFEEYFLYHPKSSDPESFEAQFARAINREDVDIGVVIALREDGLSKLDRFQERIPNLLSNRLRLNHLDEVGARAAICSPLEVWNRKYAAGQPPVTIEDALVDQLLEQVRIGRVAVGRQGGSGTAGAEQRFIEAPFLQLVMTRLWSEEMAEGSRVLRLGTLNRLQGAKEIVRTHLDNVMAKMDATSQAVCASFFDRLVTPSGSKIACSRDDLTRWAGALAPHVPATLAILHDSRILRTVAAAADKPESTSYEIFHDVLAPAIVEWHRHYVDAQERTAAVEQAREQAAKRALRKWVVRLAAMFLFAMAGWVMAYWQRVYAEADQNAAESVAVMPFDGKRGLDLALAAVDQTRRFGLAPTTNAADALARSYQAPQRSSARLNGVVSDVTFSPDGRRLAMGDRGGTAHIWNTASNDAQGRYALPLSLHDGVYAVAFLPDGQRFVTSAGTTVLLWSLDGVASAEPLVFNHGTPISSAIAISRDGTRLATATGGGGEGERDIKVWDLETGSPDPIATMDVRRAWVVGLAFSPDGWCLATANVERGRPKTRMFTEIWNIQTQAKILRVPDLTESNAVAFSPDGTSLVTAGRDTRVRIWQPAIGALDDILAERSAQSAEAALVASDPTAKPVEPTDIPWASRVLAGHREQVRGITFSSDGARIASAGADGTTIVWQVDTGERLLTLAGHKGFVNAVSFSPDDQWLATGGSDNTFRVWSITGQGEGAYTIAFSPDGTKLATAGRDRLATIWDVTSSTPRSPHTLRGHAHAIYRLAFDPAGDRLATASFDTTAKLWDVHSGALLRTFQGPKDRLRDVAFSPDGRYLATASADGTARLYALDQADAQPTPVEHDRGTPDTAIASAVTFHPTRPEWVTGGWDGKLQLWDFAGNNLGEIVHADAEKISPPHFIAIAFSRDGNEIAALSTQRVYIWSLARFRDQAIKARTISTITDKGYCDALEYSPDGLQLAIGCSDGGVRFYDTATGRLQNTITVHTAAVSDVAFSPDATTLATTSLDNTFRLTPLRFGALYDMAKQLQGAVASTK